MSSFRGDARHRILRCALTESSDVVGGSSLKESDVRRKVEDERVEEEKGEGRDDRH